MPVKKIRVAHLVPGMVFGGVEVAILKSYPYLNELFDYDVFYVRKKGELNVGQRNVFSMLLDWLIKEKPHDLVITSLWWSHLFGMLASTFGVKWVAFIHSTGSSSILDYCVTRIALQFCKNIVFDSDATRDKFEGEYSGDCFVVPYIFAQKYEEMAITENPTYDISWVGRNSKEKRLDLLVRLIVSLAKYSMEIRYCVCVAGESYTPLDDIAATMSGSICLNYNVVPNKVIELNRDSKMILCLSDYEGFSATTADAVLCGNYVAARKVGDLPNYLCGDSTIWLKGLDDISWEEFVKDIVDVINNEEECHSRRLNSKTFTTGRLAGKTYTESLSRVFRLVCDEK